MIELYTAGESHGRAIITMITGLPYGIPFNLEFINSELKRRQGGYGRSKRMQLETDTIEVICGIRNNKTISAPVVFMIANKARQKLPPITRPRPGHADLAGALKFGLYDCRDIVERASARETAARVAAGAFANYILSTFSIHVIGYVIQIGKIRCQIKNFDYNEIKKNRNKSLFYFPAPGFDQKAKQVVDNAIKKGDTIGGVFEIVASGVPPGLGSHSSWHDKIDTRISAAVMSIPSVKAVEFGAGFKLAEIEGSKAHDVIKIAKGKIVRGSNLAGGIEGGLTNGQPIIIRCACKPVPTLKTPLDSIELPTGKSTRAHYERADVCVVPACSVIGEAVVSFELLRAFLKKFYADTYNEIKENYARYLKYIKRRFTY